MGCCIQSLSAFLTFLCQVIKLDLVSNVIFKCLDFYLEEASDLYLFKLKVTFGPVAFVISSADLLG